MSSVNFDTMSTEDINYFKEKYISLFTRIKNINYDFLKEAEKRVPNPDRVDNLNITFKGKLLFVAKKLFVNTLFSKITGVSQTYLDYDLDEVMTSSGRIRRYSRSNPILLGLAVSRDLNMGIEKAIELLNTNDEKQIIEVLKKLDGTRERYLTLTNFDYNQPSFEHVVLKVLQEDLGILKKMSVDKSLALIKQGYNIELPVNIYDEIDQIYRGYGKSSKSL